MNIEIGGQAVLGITILLALICVNLGLILRAIQEQTKWLKQQDEIEQIGEPEK